VQSIESAISAARLEASRARADASRARGEYDRLERASRRQQMLLSEGATPRIQAEKAQREFETAQAEFQGLEAAARRAEDRVTELMKELDTAKKVLDDRNAQLESVQAKHTATELLSPAEGLVIARKGEVGEPVGPEKHDFLQIAVNLTRLEAVVEPPPPELALIKAGQPALVTVPGQAGEGILGSVKGVDHNQVIVEFNNPNPGIRPGMHAQVRIKVSQAPPPAAPPGR
jgi:cobalt-zinc-cadmium efflux system membrane fusion protein